MAPRGQQPRRCEEHFFSSFLKNRTSREQGKVRTSGPYRRAIFTPSQGCTGCGGRHRSSPTGGLAYGIPLQEKYKYVAPRQRVEGERNDSRKRVTSRKQASRQTTPPSSPVLKERVNIGQQLNSYLFCSFLWGSVAVSKVLVGRNKKAPSPLLGKTHPFASVTLSLENGNDLLKLTVPQEGASHHAVCRLDVYGPGVFS